MRAHRGTWGAALIAGALAAGALLPGCDPEDPNAAGTASVSIPVPLTRVAAGAGPSAAAENTERVHHAASRPGDASQSPRQHAETRPAFAVPPFLPLEAAATGDWAIYRSLDGRELRYDIARAGAGIVEVQVAVRESGRLIGLPAVREELRDLDPLARLAAAYPTRRSAQPEIIHVAGREWEATRYEDRWVDHDEVSYLRQTWVSREAPVYGTLRMELRGDGALEARLELIACRRRPPAR